MHRSVFALCASVTVLTAGCAGSTSVTSVPQPSPGNITYDEYNREYGDEQTKLPPLPNGYTWPKKGPLPKTFDGILVYPLQGTGRFSADGFWECAWQIEWLRDLSDSPERARRDLTALRAALTFYAQTDYTDPADRHILIERLDRAALGDPSLVRMEVSSSCGIPGMPAH